MGEINICWMIWTRAAGNINFSAVSVSTLPSGQSSANVARQQSERSPAIFHSDYVRKTLTHARLLINHVIGMVKDIGKEERSSREWSLYSGF